MNKKIHLLSPAFLLSLCFGFGAHAAQADTLSFYTPGVDKTLGTTQVYKSGTNQITVSGFVCGASSQNGDDQGNQGNGGHPPV